MHDVAVVGGGIAGMATAARLQAAGLDTIVFEAHGQVGGCAGFFRRRGFAFDVGATTLVDFEPGGVGGELLDRIGLAPVQGEVLPGYVAWLPDRTVTLHRDTACWAGERLRALGDSPAHRRFWALMDELARAFWTASRRGVRLPVRGPADALRALGCLGVGTLPLLRYLRWTVGDVLRHFGLRGEPALVGLLSMLLEDTVHAPIDAAPLINGALGITIRGAGLTRARGGMYGFWRRFVGHYRAQGGKLCVGCPVLRIERHGGAGFLVRTRRGDFEARQVVSAVPATLTARLGPPEVERALRPFLQRDESAQGGAIVVFVGVPEEEVLGQAFTHHQLLQSYESPLGNGNNMFVSVSAPDDSDSAPSGCRAVMISTHCELEEWEGLSADEYRARKQHAGERLIRLARRVYPDLGQRAVVNEVATPRTYERFTHRLRGAVGGVRQTLHNSNQHALPHDIGVPGFWLAGDTTWPGLGTVACVLGSRIVAEGVLAARRSWIGESNGSSVPPREKPASRDSLPRLDELGSDLLVTGRCQRWLACARPFVGVAAFGVAAWFGWWWATPLIVFLIFVAIVTVTHDVVHGSLGLTPRQTEWALFLFGAVLLESGHAYRTTHLQHHRVFPGPDDPEGDPARMTLLAAVLFGPLFLPRLWWWAYRRNKGRPGQQRWLLAEAAWALALPGAGMLLLPWTPAVLVYCVLAIVGSWVYPLLTVHLPHHGYGETPLFQTATLRGRVIPALFLELTYHLEHHLYPAVPSHHLSELSRRLEPLFRDAGVKPRRVP
jgi:C-3',4' desaturase CrtD